MSPSGILWICVLLSAIAIFTIHLPALLRAIVWRELKTCILCGGDATKGHGPCWKFCDDGSSLGASSKESWGKDGKWSSW